MTTPMLRPISIYPSHHIEDSAVRIEKVIPHLSAIMEILGLNLEDEGIRETPVRVATMFVKEAFRGLDPVYKPKMTVFRNTAGYREMLLEKGITFTSYCEHHLLPFFGRANLAYFPQRHLIGLSKLNRLVQYLASKPQTQERLTVEIDTELREALGTEDVAVLLEATHLCIASRGVKDIGSITRTSSFRGRFEEKEHRNEFFQQIQTKQVSIGISP